MSKSDSRMRLGCMLALLPFVIVPLVAAIMGVYHAFCESVVLGIGAFLLSESLTPVIEIFDWFTEKDLWHELAVLLGLV